MNFEITEDQQILRQTVRRFAEESLATDAALRDHAPKSAWPTSLADLGLWSLAVPEAQGGAGFDLLTGALAIEELAARDAAVACAVALTNAVVVPALAAGQHPLRDAVAAGTSLVGLSWQAESAGGVSGTIQTAAAGATHRVSRELDGGSARWVLSELGGEACSETIGLRALSNAPESTISKTDLLLDDVALDREAYIRTGALLAAVGVGIAAGALRLALTYADERHQFKRPLHGFQAIQFKLATMATEVEAARQLTHRACLTASPRDSRLALCLARECAFNVADEALQIHGGYGYTREYPVERHFRDAVQLSTLDLWELR
ncbi:acyl-CoA dehydrogenase family protein [Lujinxingia sediminis]|nr:acyl-CoA dehydrogenase family protein [Lujinxingia sediminis]